MYSTHHKSLYTNYRRFQGERQEPTIEISEDVSMDKEEDMEPIIRNAEQAAYILQIPPQAFREQAKRGRNDYSCVASGKKRRTYEFYPYKAAETLRVPIEMLERRNEEYQRGRNNDM